MPWRMSHPEEMVDVSGWVGNLSQEWRDHPEPVQLLCRGTLTQTGTCRTSEGRAPKQGGAGGALAEL